MTKTERTHMDDPEGTRTEQHPAVGFVIHNHPNGQPDPDSTEAEIAALGGISLGRIDGTGGSYDPGPGRSEFGG